MSTVTLELSIRDTTAEVEVTLTGGDEPHITAVSLCDGCIDIDIDTLMLLMGQSEWAEFVCEAQAKRDAQPVEAIPGLTGWPSVEDAAYLNRR